MPVQSILRTECGTEAVSKHHVSVAIIIYKMKDQDGTVLASCCQVCSAAESHLCEWSPAWAGNTSLLPRERLLEWLGREKFQEIPAEATSVAPNPPSLCLQNPTLGYYQLSVLHANVVLC